MTFLLGIVPLLPTIFTILGWVLKWMGANEAVLEKYKQLVISTQESGLLSVNVKDRLLSQHDRILARRAAAAKLVQPPPPIEKP